MFRVPLIASLNRRTLDAGQDHQGREYKHGGRSLTPSTHPFRSRYSAPLVRNRYTAPLVRHRYTAPLVRSPLSGRLFELRERASGSHAGAVAQLGEHLLCKQGVTGSKPVGSTTGAWASKDYGVWLCGGRYRNGLTFGPVAQLVRARA